MVRAIAAFLLVCLLAPFAAAQGAADGGPPYTEEQFFVLSNPRGSFLQNEARLRDWWSIQPEYLKKRILTNPRDWWWPIILCNYQGYNEPQRQGAALTACEKMHYDERQRAIGRWTPDGQYLGPDEACRARNKRDEWGRLLCN